ncbi:MAG: hypothetical protein Q4G43_10135 [Mobilicoccus sp.]|nr:hypothetical protein [Mobilicoccus sp.]
MTNENPRAAIDAAQTLLEQCQSDVERIEEFLPWLSEAVVRMRELGDYYQGDGQAHLSAVLAEDPSAVLPPVMNEDSVWETGAAMDDHLLRLLRIVTAEITSGLDKPGC